LLADDDIHAAEPEFTGKHQPDWPCADNNYTNSHVSLLNAIGSILDAIHTSENWQTAPSVTYRVPRIGLTSIMLCGN
jgi:hypothetical protein